MKHRFVSLAFLALVQLASAENVIILCDEANVEVGGAADNIRCNGGQISTLNEQQLVNAVAAQISGLSMELTQSDITDLSSAVLIYFCVCFAVRMVRKFIEPRS